MIKVYCHTNIDVSRSEVWPKELPCRPMKGDIIESLTGWERLDGPGEMYHLQLEVCRVTFPASARTPDFIEVELHLPVGRFENIPHFARIYKEITGAII